MLDLMVNVSLGQSANCSPRTGSLCFCVLQVPVLTLSSNSDCPVSQVALGLRRTFDADFNMKILLGKFLVRKLELVLAKLAEL